MLLLPVLHWVKMGFSAVVIHVNARASFAPFESFANFFSIPLPLGLPKKITYKCFCANQSHLPYQELSAGPNSTKNASKLPLRNKSVIQPSRDHAARLTLGTRVNLSPSWGGARGYLQSHDHSRSSVTFITCKYLTVHSI